MTVIDRKKGENMNGQAILAPYDYALFERIRDMGKAHPRVAILMSGTGSNARKILEQRCLYPNLNVVAIGTDRPGFHSAHIARAFGLQWILVEQWGQIPFDREEFFKNLTYRLRALHVDFLIYAGFMKVSPKDFLNEFPGLNMHPADLTIVTQKGRPKYTGISAVSYAINAGESYIASTVHVVEETVDSGLIIAVSKHVPLVFQGLCDAHELQEKLKHAGEHTLYPQVLALLSRGKITQDMIPLYAEDQDLDALIAS